MKKIVLFSSMLCMAALFGATGTFAPVWGDKATYSSDLAALATPDKVYPETIDGKKYLKVMRGGQWHAVQFLEPLKADDNYSYSFTVLRSQADSSFMSIVCAEMSKPGIGSVFINPQGTVYAMNDKGQWKATPFIFRPDREYKINVSVSNSAKTYKISIDGAGEFEIASVYRENADKIVFAPQSPDKNVNYIGDFKIYFAE